MREKLHSCSFSPLPTVALFLQQFVYITLAMGITNPYRNPSTVAAKVKIIGPV
jgi:hypothetical protein